MKVGLVTTWYEMCGIAEYSHNLVTHCPEVEFKIITRPYHPANLIPQAQDCDLVNFQYESGFLGIFHPGVMQMFGKPTVLTLHDNHETNNRAIYPFTNEADRVVVHEDTKEGFIHIPQPVINVVGDFPYINPSILLGTAGFPLPHKGMIELAAATRLLVAEGVVGGVKMIAPVNPHCNTYDVMYRVQAEFPNTAYLTEWMEQLDVIQNLSECAVIVYPYHPAKLGPSAAVRLGLATKRPMVVSRCGQFRDLYSYEDEIEFIEGEVTGNSIAEAVKRVLKNGKRPKRILQDMSWHKAGELYKNLYTKLLEERKTKCA